MKLPLSKIDYKSIISIIGCPPSSCALFFLGLQKPLAFALMISPHDVFMVTMHQKKGLSFRFASLYHSLPNLSSSSRARSRASSPQRVLCRRSASSFFLASQRNLAGSKAKIRRGVNRTHRAMSCSSRTSQRRHNQLAQWLTHR